MVMEYCEHGSLFDVMHDNNEVFTWNRILQWFMEATKGVEVLHNWDPPLVHRDLKSLNLLVDSNWNLKAD
jgi:serine/threonine protein kinase